MRLRAIVVDDESMALDLLRELLEPLDCEVHTFLDSTTAAQRLDAEKFDFVITDVKMPAMNGFELTRRLRASSWNAHTPIALITGLGDADTMREGFDAGADFFLVKPFQSQQIARIVHVITAAIDLRRRRSRRLPFRTTVRCQLEEKNFEAASLNIGENGMMLQLPSWVNEGQVFELRFELPGSKRPLVIRARTFRRDEIGQMAVHFLGLNSYDLEKIQQFLDPK